MRPNLHKQQVTMRDGVTVTLRFVGYDPKADDRLYEARGYAEPISLLGTEVEANRGA